MEGGGQVAERRVAAIFSKKVANTPSPPLGTPPNTTRKKTKKKKKKERNGALGKAGQAQAPSTTRPPKTDKTETKIEILEKKYR